MIGQPRDPDQDVWDFLDQYDPFADEDWYYSDDDDLDLYDDWDGEIDISELYVDRHAQNRDQKRSHITGMQMSGRSTKSVLLPAIAKRASSPRKGRHAR
jgi:hypothetical protein